MPWLGEELIDCLLFLTVLTEKRGIFTFVLNKSMCKCHAVQGGNDPQGLTAGVLEGDLAVGFLCLDWLFQLQKTL